MAILFALVSTAMTLVGGAVALKLKDKRHLILGLAAGIMLGVVMFDLIPEAIDLSHQQVAGIPAVMITLAGGFFTFHILERGVALHQHHEGEYSSHDHRSKPVGLLIVLGLVFHSTLDGFGIGLGFQSGAALGLAVAVAIIAHDFADGFNTFTIATLYGNHRRAAIALVGLDAIAPVVGAVLGTILKVPPQALGLYLGYFSGVLLYLAACDILPEAHASHPSRVTLMLTLLGTLGMAGVVALTHL